VDAQLAGTMATASNRYVRTVNAAHEWILTTTIPDKAVDSRSKSRPLESDPLRPAHCARVIFFIAALEKAKSPFARKPLWSRDDGNQIASPAYAAPSSPLAPGQRNRKAICSGCCLSEDKNLGLGLRRHGYEPKRGMDPTLARHETFFLVHIEYAAPPTFS